MRWRGSVFLAICFAVFPSLAQTTGTLAGSWRLTEQYYGEGRQNFAQRGESLELEFVPGVSGLSGTVRYQNWKGDWPAWFTPQGPATLLDVQDEQPPDGRSISCRFRVPQNPGDSTFLRVKEDCRLQSDDRLACDVEVTFEVNGQPKGGFVWHRIFAREGRP